MPPASRYLPNRSSIRNSLSEKGSYRKRFLDRVNALNRLRNALVRAYGLWSQPNPRREGPSLRTLSSCSTELRSGSNPSNLF